MYTKTTTGKLPVVLRRAVSLLKQVYDEYFSLSLSPLTPSVLPPPSQRPPPVLPAAPVQNPAVTVVKQTLPLTTVTTTSTSSVSSLQSFSVPCASSPVRTASGFLPQKGMCTFKILPTRSNKEPIVITCPKVPSQAPTKVVPVPGSFTLQPHSNPPVTPVNLISLKPSSGGGAGVGVKTVTVSAAPVGLGGVSAHQKPAASQTCTTQTSTETALRSVIPEVAPPPAPASDRSSPEPEVACGLVDLDIICVDDETMEVVNVGSSSSETENSSDFESDADGDKETIKMNPVRES